ncbi:Uu.00g054240.m01.CDS01 [Anthostomella pinea]|uniref:Uu.00g054240.m01.CDS01 n=1 Tax=Anthostomella pinea TaxID=933095 RepID=A0AAI8YPH5_9PEZI|nr:Uu.00g054240.m01.CDS01 [Anthostomella pinea]
MAFTNPSNSTQGFPYGPRGPITSAPVFGVNSSSSSQGFPHGTLGPSTSGPVLLNSSSNAFNHSTPTPGLNLSDAHFTPPFPGNMPHPKHTPPFSVAPNGIYEYFLEVGRKLVQSIAICIAMVIGSSILNVVMFTLCGVTNASAELHLISALASMLCYWLTSYEVPGALVWFIFFWGLIAIFVKQGIIRSPNPTQQPTPPASPTDRDAVTAELRAKVRAMVFNDDNITMTVMTHLDRSVGSNVQALQRLATDH